MPDDTPREPLTAAEIAVVRYYASGANGALEKDEATLRLLATLDAIPDDLGDAYRRIRELEARPSGDEALRAALEDELWGLGGDGNVLVRIEEAVAALRSRWSIETRLATPSSAPDHREGRDPGNDGWAGSGRCARCGEPWPCPSSAPARHEHHGERCEACAAEESGAPDVERARRLLVESLPPDFDTSRIDDLIEAVRGESHG